MLSTFYRCMGITCNIHRGSRRPRRRGASGAARGPAGLARPSSSPPPPSRRTRSRPGPGRPDPDFVVAASTVAAHPDPPGARPVRPGLSRRRLRRRGAPGAARGPAGLARPSSSPPPPSPARRIRSRTGPGRPDPTFVVAASAVARPARPSSSPPPPSRRNWSRREVGIERGREGAREGGSFR